MEFTFGIITSGANDHLLSIVIQSIIQQQIPQFEIIVVGKTSIIHDSVQCIDFDESIKPNWITRKKNMISQRAQYDHIVFLHDYVALCEDWYRGFIEFGSNFDICVTKIKTIHGNRFRDYTLFPHDLGYPYNERALLPYDYNVTSKLNKLLYISGTYYVMKKSIALAYPLNELLCWGHGEDAELSKRLSDRRIILQCNPYSTVQLQKHKGQCNWEHVLTNDEIAHLESLSDIEIDRMNQISKKNIKNYIMDMIGVDIYYL